MQGSKRSRAFPSQASPTPTPASQLETSVRSVPSPAIYWLWSPVPSSSLSPSFVSLALPWFGPLLSLLISELEMSLCFQAQCSCLPQETLPVLSFLPPPRSPPRFIPTNTTECALVRHPYPNPALPSDHCPISLLPTHQEASSKKKPTLHNLPASSVPIQSLKSSFLPHHNRDTFP